MKIESIEVDEITDKTWLFPFFVMNIFLKSFEKVPSNPNMLYKIENSQNTYMLKDKNGNIHQITRKKSENDSIKSNILDDYIIIHHEENSNIAKIIKHTRMIFKSVDDCDEYIRNNVCKDFELKI